MLFFAKTRLKRRVLKGIQRLTNEELERALAYPVYFEGRSWNTCLFGVATGYDPKSGLLGTLAFLDEGVDYLSLQQRMGREAAATWAREQLVIELVTRLEEVTAAA